MPRKRRIPKLRRRMALHASDLTISELLELTGAPRVPFGTRASVRWSSWEEYTDVYEAVKDEILPTADGPGPEDVCIAGQRPGLWWDQDAPGPRLIIGRRPVYRYPGGRPEPIGWEDVWEPDPAALARLGCLFEWERARLRPEAFEPINPWEVVRYEVPREPESEDDPDDDEDPEDDTPSDEEEEAHDGE